MFIGRSVHDVSDHHQTMAASGTAWLCRQVDQPPAEVANLGCIKTVIDHNNVDAASSQTLLLK